jgi:hypothetical protein
MQLLNACDEEGSGDELRQRCKMDNEEGDTFRLSQIAQDEQRC